MNIFECVNLEKWEENRDVLIFQKRVEIFVPTCFLNQFPKRSLSLKLVEKNQGVKLLKRMFSAE